MQTMKIGNNEVVLLDTAMPPQLPEGSHVMTATIEIPPGDPGTPPHRHSGPVFGYMLEGEMLFELEGEPERVIKAGGVVLGAGRRRHPLPVRQQPARPDKQVPGRHGVRARPGDAGAG